MRATVALASALVLPALLAGCSGGGEPNEMTIVVSNSALARPEPVEAWLRIESVRGDMKFNEPVTVGHDERVELSMGDLQGALKFTVIARDHTHTEEEQMEPDEDWHIDIRSDGSSCFRFGIDGANPSRCG